MNIQPMPATHTPSILAASETDLALNYVFTTALEGGIGYWSTCTRYKHGVEHDGRYTAARDFIAVITETGDGDGTEVHVIDRTVISRGIRKAFERGNWNDYQAAALRNLAFCRYDDADYDAITADLIVQMGLFGEVRYQ